ncbi:MAG: response regulator transcription factor [Clostridiaceae bacterium]|nr:LytTR family DNA-binding domain-containing protein [Bacillota bacterium]NLP06838.1 response regulator transcription factor [Clostridiaceae bacterium]
MSIRVLIADDDSGMRLVLKKAVEKYGGFVIAGEAEDGGAALRIFESQRPEVVFLDVEMPVMTGIECAKRIADIDPRAIIIFATAHEGYMPEAFEVYAFDYLVKPFKLQRLGQTLERIKGISSLRQDVSENKVIRSANVPRKLIIRNKESISFVDMEEIILVQREDRATAIYTVQDRFVTSDNLGDVEQKLDESMFIRCHKSYIININYIDKIYPYGRWTYIVKLKGTDRDALMTRESFDRLENILE